MRKLIVVFLLISLVSLFADIAYEGGRSISGQFLSYLGAPAIAAGVLALGEFLGYATRLPVGIAISLKRSSRFLWATIILGYTLVISIPLLALVVDWRLSLILYLVERLGKGLRTPARDIIVADITDKRIGKGKAFGIHELLDQVGALLGPLVVSYAITYKGEFGYAFAVLLPATLVAIALVSVASILYPHISSISNAQVNKSTLLSLNKQLKHYLVFVAILSLGLIHWGLVSYHLSYTNTVPPNTVPLLYALAMIIDAIVAVPLGIIYDIYKLSVLTIIPLLSAPIAPLLLLTKNTIPLIIASALYGVVLCSYESILRAAIADIAFAHERAIGFGLMGFVWGISWGFGNTIAGVLYDVVGPGILCIIYPMINIVAFIYTAAYLGRDRL